MADRKRNIEVKFRVTDEERKLIEQKMQKIGTANMAAYLRKMAIDGLIIRLDLPQLNEMISLLKRCSNNLNQIAKRANATGSIYETDIEDLKNQQEHIWEAAQKIVSELAMIK